jgi:hypothetical protein
MPDPRDHMDDDYEYVGGYVRRKPDRRVKVGKKAASGWVAFWTIAIAIGLSLLIVYPDATGKILLGLAIMAVIFLVIPAAILFGLVKLFAKLVNRLRNG